MTTLLGHILARCDELKASDVHLAWDEKPRYRIQGRLLPDSDSAALKRDAVDSLAMELGLFTLPKGCPDGTERIRYVLMKEGAIDGVLTAANGSRFRFNVFCEAERHAVALRRLPSGFRSLEELSLPRRIGDFTECRDGLVIVTGPTGSGKSTTLATLIDSINRTRAAHIITIEDPVEYVHRSALSLVRQRQIGRDAKSFNDALVEAMRQDPDVLLVGEIRNLDAIRTALRAAETGHLVFTTLHAGDCAGAIERIISVFPADEQSGARHQLALVLRGIVAQHLLADDKGLNRHPAAEILVNTAAVANLIATGRTAQIYSQIETGAAYGMRTLEQSLAELVVSGRIGENTAYAASRNPQMLKTRLTRK
ncbi:MAG: PilT/PilU family type 4a pilus ATPase [Kiritimatiellae bacterium]|nr:PilT/PilU family type 4a pilus ATPase [Kiritimatiellia bacterium]